MEVLGQISVNELLGSVKQDVLLTDFVINRVRKLYVQFLQQKCCKPTNCQSCDKTYLTLTLRYSKYRKWNKNNEFRITISRQVLCVNGKNDKNRGRQFSLQFVCFYKHISEFEKSLLCVGRTRHIIYIQCNTGIKANIIIRVEEENESELFNYAL